MNSARVTSSSSLRGIATTAFPCEPVTAWRSSSSLRGIATPHSDAGCDGDVESSSSLRGIATMRFWSPSGRGPSPHRPYEGLQRDLRPLIPEDAPASSSSLRGIATGTAGSATSSPTGPHRPYEGLQLLILAFSVTAVLVLIVPTRDCNSIGSSVPDLTGLTSSSSLRGIATSVSIRRPVVHSGPHRPYEGLQQEGDRYAVWHCDTSSSSLRGIATVVAAR